ncbi:uncharacterized protein BDZ99DRAFT_530477 [Mytilinidion resinicola]|uniref:Uncharacterized protein n=1 Tax=Mytilinidion resinicola TaxID=574789 RepID=A0A6A6Z974_9PEZI|nr:uncharacterized protein BDZ99DRAFT_530477 [Mytilinidion resinicola]KAF2817566.1 hypothetical protein BDZ99DRAFT_530477 [Mytilinidion resinicola]
MPLLILVTQPWKGARPFTQASCNPVRDYRAYGSRRILKISVACGAVRDYSRILKCFGQSVSPYGSIECRGNRNTEKCCPGTGLWSVGLLFTQEQARALENPVRDRVPSYFLYSPHTSRTAPSGRRYPEIEARTNPLRRPIPYGTQPLAASNPLRDPTPCGVQSPTGPNPLRRPNPCGIRSPTGSNPYGTGFSTVCAPCGSPCGNQARAGTKPVREPCPALHTPVRERDC